MPSRGRAFPSTHKPEVTKDFGKLRIEAVAWAVTHAIGAHLGTQLQTMKAVHAKMRRHSNLKKL
jgi:hypothetical protein